MLICKALLWFTIYRNVVVILFSWSFPANIELSTDWCTDSIADIGTTPLKTICLLPEQDVSFNCSVPDRVIIWSSPQWGMQDIHGSNDIGELGSNIYLQLNSFDVNSTCTRATANILNTDRSMNGLELTCATTSFEECRLIFSTTLTLNVLGK